MFSRSIIKTFCPRSRGLASLPVRRPRRFWDLHVPDATWDYRRRVMPHNPPQADRSRERARNWISIPDANLPEPWTCNWVHWPYWAGSHPLEATLSARYALSDAPLTPVMFNSSNETATTVFACATTGKYYLYYGQWALPELPEEVHAFEGAFSSVEAFIEQAGWNRMEKMNLARWDDSKPLSSNIPDSDFNRGNGSINHRPSAPFDQ
ncbi:hypothetical protein C8J57DRAFT_1592128 [Mycena rebaudengoi]|nr:hypothetical protein C8J57DRAFT_1592128 [Mycena rebaudengoi]